MSKELTRTTEDVARRRWGFEANTIAFPTALRDAIPDLPTCAGRVLKLDSISGAPPDGSRFGRRVRLNLVARETGKLTGEYTVRIDLARRPRSPWRTRCGNWRRRIERIIGGTACSAPANPLRTSA